MKKIVHNLLTAFLFFFVVVILPSCHKDVPEKPDSEKSDVTVMIYGAGGGRGGGANRTDGDGTKKTETCKFFLTKSCKCAFFLVILYPILHQSSTTTNAKQPIYIL